MTKELVSYAHSKDVKVNVWTIDDIEMRSKLIQYGVDFITTDLFTRNKFNTQIYKLKLGPNSIR